MSGRERKRLLGSPEQSAITLHFLSAVPHFPVPIRQVQILNPTLEKGFGDDKWSLLDILAMDESKRLYDIEVPTTRPLGLRQRLKYYASSLLVGQLESGGDYRDLRPLIDICRLDAIQFLSKIALHHFLTMGAERAAADRLLAGSSLRVAQVRAAERKADDQRPDRTVAVLFRRAEASTAEELTVQLPDAVFAEATEVPERIAQNPDERGLYNERLKLERDQRARNLQACEEGRQEGEFLAE